MRITAKRFIDRGGKGLTAASDGWLITEPLTTSILKAWRSVSLVAPDDVTLRLRSSDGQILQNGLIALEEPTYIVVNVTTESADLFSMSAASLDACSEVLRKFGGVSALSHPPFGEFSDDAILERASIYSPARKAFIHEVYDYPIAKRELVARLVQEQAELQSYVFRIKASITAGPIRLSAFGLDTDAWVLEIADKASGRSLPPTKSTETSWAREVASLLVTVFDSPTRIVV